MVNKKLLIITQYYPPEIGGGSQRSAGFAEELSDLGVDITVLTPFPSYLMVKNNKNSKFKLFEVSKVNNINICRTLVYASDRGNAIKRMFYYLSFTLSSLIFVIFKIKKIDYVLTISPPLFTGIVGVIVKKFKSAKLIFDIGDLWPESIILLGYLRNKLVIKLATGLEKYIYKQSDLINVTTYQTLIKLKQQYDFIKNILLVPNFVEESKFLKRSQSNEILTKYKLKNKLILGYAGNIGICQGIEIITQAAKRTRDLSNVVYVIIGDGVEKNLVSDSIKKNNLNNVLLLPPVPREEINDYISVFDAVIIPLVKNEIFEITIPSKLYEAMASEKMVLICVDGEARKIVEEANCGIYIEPENSQMLAEKIRYLNENRSLISDLGKNGKETARNKYSRTKIVKDFYNQLNLKEF